MRHLVFAAASAAVLLQGTEARATERLVALDSSRAIYELDMNNGSKTQIGTVSANASTTAGLAYDRANGILYLTSTGNDSLFTLDLATGNATLIGFYGDSSLVMHGLEYDDSTGTLYGGSNGNLYRIDKNTGVATLVGISGLTSFTNLGYDSNNDVLYATNSGSDSFYRVDRTTGAMTLIGALQTSTNPNGLAYDWSGRRLFMIDNSTDNLYTINLATGAATVIGSTGSGNLLGLVYLNDSPQGVTITGRVHLEDWLGPIAGRAVDMEIYDAGTSNLRDVQVVNLDAAGSYVLVSNSIGNGTYDVYAKASHWLRRIRPSVVVPGGVTGVSFSLANGDCDWDNEVAIGDFSLLSTAFNSVPGDSNWNPEADLNGDNEVDIGDFAILSFNFGMIGD
ncbi:MAG TPA: hypothetical protein PLL78_10565 [Fimbriimonadaceae bacterium]|nr:hypothetical protein [Fimbriimonadaceae bacterium]HRJ97118.1 hypothetical protein [Fimbriimonadaceae bacterium]